ncbi:heme oxygenase-like protein [Knoellia remsis]|uniref:Heme oxygenase-like protein n=1 Tax=Knoellia remsis TaxID=407159 RepID=A0A2T0U4W2_9MICO|nr:iron-containing redox enzyme family protein [Knoellia remsis]PRY52956.1 heme oxygenase-like protein [Knoellia remsis]
MSTTLPARSQASSGPATVRTVQPGAPVPPAQPAAARATERATAPALPQPRGPISQAVIEHCAGTGGDAPWSTARDVDAYGEDLHLALYVLYELHYRGFAGVDPELEWDLDLVALRLELEKAFLARLRRDTDADAVEALDETDLRALLDEEVDTLLTEVVGAPSVSRHLMTVGTLEQFREYVTHRSAYHLKEADPQLLVVPRIEGPAKSGLMTVQHDEYGSGRASAMHSELFAAMMRELGLDAGYGALVDRVSGTVLAEVNLMSMTGLHRSLRGASVGQFAVIELTSSPGSARLVKAAQRLGCGPATEYYYAEHVEADAVHEQILRRDVLAPLVEAEPEIAADIVFGIRASGLLATRFGDAVLGAWADGRSSLG